METESGKSPFKDSLIEHSAHGRETVLGKLLQIGEDPSLVVRKIDLDHIDYDQASETVSDIESTARELTAALDELREKYKINVVPTRLMIAEDADGNPTLFAVSDNIIQSRKPKETAKAKAALFGKLIDFLVDKAHSNSRFLADIIDPTQYVYGRKEGGAQDFVYLVDIDPKFRAPTAAHFQSQIQTLRSRIKDRIHEEYAEGKRDKEFINEDYAPFLERLKSLSNELKARGN